ncbi:MAG: hypothetical protein ACJA1M_000246 [Alphaproteobacteria bacterium]|jgi:hypothetical protein
MLYNVRPSSVRLSGQLNTGRFQKTSVKAIQPKALTHHIAFSNTEKTTHKTKNFITMNKGFPIQDKIFTLKIKANLDASRMEEDILLPLLRTNNKGVMYILTNPIFDKQGIDIEESGYQPLKYSRRLGFVVKHEKTLNSLNPFYRSKMISKYIDLGISEHFLRTVITKSNIANNPVDATKSTVCKNWHNAFLSDYDVKKEYRDFNTHTERTSKSRKYMDYGGYIAMATGAAGLITASAIATAGLVLPASIAIGGGVLALGSAQDSISRSMLMNPADISRPRNTKKLADQEIQSFNIHTSKNQIKNKALTLSSFLQKNSKIESPAIKYLNFNNYYGAIQQSRNIE